MQCTLVWHTLTYIDYIVLHSGIFNISLFPTHLHTMQFRKFFVKGGIGHTYHPSLAVRWIVAEASCTPKGSEANPSKRLSSPTLAARKKMTRNRRIHKKSATIKGQSQLPRLQLSISQTIEPLDGFKRTFPGLSPRFLGNIYGFWIVSG